MAGADRRLYSRHTLTAAVFPCLVKGLNRALRAVAVILFLAALFLPLVASAAIRVDPDFTLELRVNGTDIQYQETIVFDPAEDLVVDIYITGCRFFPVMSNCSCTFTFPRYRCGSDGGRWG